MSMHKYGNNKDKNHKQVVQAFKDLGFVVLDVSNMPNCCDIIVSKDMKTIAVEIKSGAKKKLTPGETKFGEYWHKQGYWRVIRSIDDVLLLNYQLVNSQIENKGVS